MGDYRDAVPPSGTSDVDFEDMSSLSSVEDAASYGR